MSKEKVLEKLFEMVRDNLLLEEGTVLTKDSDLIKEVGLDSMDIVSLGMEVQDEFEVEITPEELNIEVITLDFIADLIIQRQTNMAPA
ncbi:acyl carrier protein [Teredinibacter waterburyi]|uniref:acyl carrier protein n=1 Tax=Teredinibacter waterburyi TaxID=1500538 RepID=UPI00165F233A|nr:phosphopantetheine-binding protein [Teredinibacter waterburyi]